MTSWAAAILQKQQTQTHFVAYNLGKEALEGLEALANLRFT